MTALYILIGIAALLVLLLLLPIRLSLIYCDTLSLSLSYLFFHFPIYPKEKKVRLSDYTPRKLRRKKRKAAKKRRQEAIKATQAKKPPKTLEQKLRQIRLILYILKNAYKDILSAVKIRVRRFYVTVATGDAAKTAILYGTIAQGTAYLTKLLRDHTKTTVKRGGVNVVADFLEQSSTLDTELVFSVTPLSILGLGLRAALLFLTYKLKKQPDKSKTE